MSIHSNLVLWTENEVTGPRDLSGGQVSKYFLLSVERAVSDSLMLEHMSNQVPF